MIDPTAMSDASALVVGTDNELCARVDLNAGWTATLDKRRWVIGVLVVQDRTILAMVGADNELHAGAGLNVNWAKALDKGWSDQ